MPRVGSIEHERVLRETIEKLERDGWRVIRLDGKSPDAIAIRDDVVMAIEILTARHRPGKGWHKSWSIKGKLRAYSMFDKVMIVVYRKEPKNY